MCVESKPFKPSQMFVSTAGANFQVLHSRVAPGFIHIRPDWKGFPGTNTNVLRTLVITAVEIFYQKGPWLRSCDLYGPQTSGLYYKHITIIIDTASIVSK
jgi:hypothetical protein